MVSRTAWSWGVLPSSVLSGGSGVHVADDDCRGEHRHLAVCFGEGLEEGFDGIAEGNVGDDDLELPSVSDDLVDT